MDYTVHGILQARILEWVTFPFSRGSSQPGDRTQVSRIVGGFFTSSATREAQEYWSMLPIPSPADLPDSGIDPGSHALQADSLPISYKGSPNINEHLLFAEAALGPGKKNQSLPQEHTVFRRDRQAVW